MRRLVPTLLILNIPALTAIAQLPFTIFTGPGAGNLIFSANGVHVAGPNAFGQLGSGPHCPPAALAYGDIIVAATTVHFHGVLNGINDPAEMECGWGHAAPGDLRGLLTTAVSSGTVRTFVLPHIVDKPGNITNATFTFDTSIYATYANEAANAPIGATAINTYLFDDTTGQPLAGANGTPVAGPSTFTVGSGTIPRKREFNLDQQIMGNGGFDGLTKTGYAVITAGGNTENVNLQGFVTNVKSNALDLAPFGFAPVELQAGANAPLPGGPLPAPPGPILLRLDNIKETPGSTNTTANVSDTLIKGVYVAGLVDGATPASVNVTLTLFKPDNTPMAEPIQFALSAADRTFSMTAEEILQSAGGITGPLEGYAIAEVSGDTSSFVLAGYHIQTNTGPNDLVHFDQTLAVQVVPEPSAALVLLALFFCRRRRGK
jgi:hypothetical protein